MVGSCVYVFFFSTTVIFPTTFGVTDKVFPLIDTLASELFTTSKFDNIPFVSVKVVVSPADIGKALAEVMRK